MWSSKTYIFLVKYYGSEEILEGDMWSERESYYDSSIYFHHYSYGIWWDLQQRQYEQFSVTISTFCEKITKLFILSFLSDLTSCLRPKDEEFFPSSGINSINTADYMVKSDILTQILFLQMFFFIKSCLPLTFHICLHHIVWDIWSNILGHYLVIDII